MGPDLRMTLWFVMWACSITQAAWVRTTSEKSVSRLNYGATYKFTGTVNPTTEIWAHSFTIALPKQDWGQVKELKRKQYSSQCTRNGTQPTGCQLFLANVRFAKKVQDQTLDNLNDIEAAIHGLIPGTVPGRGRNKKALLPFVSTLFKGLFGTAREEDVEIVAQHVASIGKLQDDQLRIVKESALHLNSYIKVSNERMDGLAQIIKNTSLETLRMVDNTATDIMTQMKYWNSVVIFTQEMQHQGSLLERQYANLLGALETLVGGFLPAFLIPAQVIQSTLNKIQEDLDTTRTRLRVTHTHPGWYYSSGTFLYTVKNGTLIITVQIPLTNIATKFSVYAITTYPMIIDQDTERLMILEDMPAGVATDVSGQYFYTMTEQELEELGTHHDSRIRKVYNLAQSESCVMAIFRDQKAVVNKLCRYTITKTKQLSGVYYLEKTAYLLINIEEYTLTCNDDPAATQPGCRSCVIQIRPGCTWSNEKWMIPKTLVDSGNRHAAVKHTTNLGLLLKFFDNSTLEKTMIQGDTLFEKAPALALPKFNYFKSDMERMFAEDDREKLNLDKVSEAVRNDQVILSSLSQAIVTGVTSSWYDFFGTTAGITLTITAGLTIVTTVNAAYLTFRTRQILITLAILKEHVLTVKSEEQLIFDFFKASAAQTGKIADASQNSSTPQDIHRVIIEATVTLWPQVLATLLGIIMLAILARKFYRTINPDYMQQATTQFLLEFEGKHTTEFVFLYKIRAQPEDLSVTAIDYITNVQVVGYICPHLRLDWHSLAITNEVTGHTLQLDTKYSIPWKSAFRLRRIIKQSYSCLPVFVNGKRLQRIYLGKPIIKQSPSVMVRMYHFGEPERTKTITRSAREAAGRPAAKRRNDTPMIRMTDIQDEE